MIPTPQNQMRLTEEQMMRLGNPAAFGIAHRDIDTPATVLIDDRNAKQAAKLARDVELHQCRCHARGAKLLGLPIDSMPQRYSNDTELRNTWRTEFNATTPPCADGNECDA